MTAGKKQELTKALRAAFSETLPVLAGFSVLGIAYGVLMDSKGYGALWSALMSAAAFCGSMQFVAVTLLTTVFDPLQAFLLSLMVNARHLFYGVSMLEKYKGLGKLRALLVFTLCDETFSIVSVREPPAGVTPRYFYLFISLLDYSYWVLASFLGGVLGALITFNTKGLDFALTALFVVLLIEQVRQKDRRLPALIGILSALLSRVIFGAQDMVIPAMALILPSLLLRRQKPCD